MEIVRRQRFLVRLGGMVMTRDLILKILMAVEAQESGHGVTDLLVDGESIETGSKTDEAARYCSEHNLIELWDKPERFGGKNIWIVKRLTAFGHDKLRELRGQDPL